MIPAVQYVWVSTIRLSNSSRIELFWIKGTSFSNKENSYFQNSTSFPCTQLYAFFCLISLNLGCECYADGTLNNGTIEICNSTSGICDCEDGYKGDKCNECDAGYYNTGTNEAPMCSGKWKEIITHI